MTTESFSSTGSGDPRVDSAGAGPVRVVVTDDLKRNRLTVLFRPLLALPLLFLLRLWMLAAFGAWVVAWVAAVVTGDVPAGLGGFIARFVRYDLHATAYASLAAGPYPNLTGEPGYAVDVQYPPRTTRKRLDVFLRPAWALPALVASAVLSTIAIIFSIVGGLIALVRGTMPRDIRNLLVFTAAYKAQTLAYGGLLADAYPAFGGPVSSSDRSESVDRPRASDLWWHSLEEVGVPESRWQALPLTARRAVIAAGVGLLLLIVIGPLSGIDYAALITFAVFVALYVPSWSRLGRAGRWVIPLAFLGLVVAFPYYTDKMFTIPILGAFPSTSTGVVMLIYIMMALGLNVVVGYAGLLDLGYVAFYALGAYTCAALASPQFGRSTIEFGAIGVDKTLGGIHISIWLLLVVAGILTSLIGMLIGLPTLRLRGDYLAIVTLGFGEILPQIARNGDNFFNTGVNVTNGPQGITPIDAIGFGSTLSGALGLPANYLTAANSDRLFFWTAIVLVLITLFCSLRLRGGKLGRAWIAIREDETAAAAMGVPLMRTKTLAYAIGAFFGGVAGAYFAEFTTGANPDSFSFNFSVFVLVMVILGGIGNVWGVMVGAALLAYLNQAGLANTGAWLSEHLHVNIDVPQYEFGIYGVILLVVMLFRPNGLIPEKRHKLELEVGVSDEYLYDVEAR